VFLAIATSMVVGCGGSDAGDGESPEPPEFEEFAWRTDTPDVRTERLCVEAAAPDDAPDTTFIDCEIEGATFSSEEQAEKDELVVLAYNILRGFEVDAQLDMITSGIAERLGYYYVYATEFVELPSDRGDTGPYDPPICEHGNALVSRYPLGNVRQIRHAENISWYTPPDAPDPDEPRLGGRIAIAADAKIGSVLVRLYVLHLESTLGAVEIRDAQAEEIAADSEDVSHPVIAGGDLNTFFYNSDIERGILTEPAVKSFVDRGYQDAHQGIPLEERYTSFDPFDMILDIILPRGVEVTSAGRCPPERCESLSDHLPVFAEVRGVLGD